jgi:hypothetical protein
MLHNSGRRGPPLITQPLHRRWDKGNLTSILYNIFVGNMFSCMSIF